MNIKKSFYIICLLLIISSLAACSDESDETESNKASNDSEEQSAENKNNDEQHTGNQPDLDDEEAQSEDKEDKQEQKDAEYQVSSDWSVKPMDDAEEKVVLLTIDDAPDEHALEMAKTLDGLDVSAIFFVNGHFIDDDEGKEILQEIDELGFPIGNHTMTHADLTTLSEDEQEEEILTVNELVEDAIGEKPKYFRAPHGKNTEYSEQLAEQEGMLLMNWSYGYDWEADYQEPEALTDIMVNSPLLNNGSILLMHDRDWTNEALADIVEGLQDKDYEMLDPELIETEDE